MKQKLILLVLGIGFMILLGGFHSSPITPPGNDTDLKIIKIEGEWMVVHASDYNKTEVKVKKKDTIVWSSMGTDVHFQFPGTLFDAIGDEDELTGGYTKFLKAGKKLKLKIKDDAPAGTYSYAVFCVVDGEFAKGGSPPKIVIE